MSEEFSYYLKNGLQIKTIKTEISKYRLLYMSKKFTRQNAGKRSSGYLSKQYFPGRIPPDPH